MKPLLFLTSLFNHNNPIRIKLISCKRIMLTLSCLIVFMLAFTPDLNAQAYTTSYHTNAGNPGNQNTQSDNSTVGWTSITNGPNSTNYWSAAQSIFAFEFFGTSFTELKFSQNALITFSDATGTPTSANTSLPNASLPDNTIAGFWDSYASPNSGDRVYTQTFGSSPDRQFWIRYHSFEIGSYSYAYFAIVLEETTNKVYMIDYNYKSGGPSSSTVGVQQNSTTAIQSTTTYSFNSGSSVRSDNDYYAYTPVASCPAPTTQTESTITTSGANLGWTETGSATYWDVYVIGTGGEAPSAGTTPTINNTTDNPVTWAGGSAGNTYDWYVRADCAAGGGTDQSTWTGPSTFNTLFEAQSFPFTENWETGSVPSAWNTYTGSVGTLEVNEASKYQGTYGLEQYGNSGSGYSTPSGLADAWTKAQIGSGDNENWTTYNEVIVDLSGTTAPELKFYYAMDRYINNNYNNFWVVVDNGSKAWTELFSTQASATIPYTQQTISLSTYIGDELTIRFFHNGKYDDTYLRLDNIEVVETPASWTGTTNNDWNSAGNWSNVVPGDGTDVTIPTGLANYPIIDEAATCNDMTIAGTATIDIAYNGSLTVSSTLTNNGTLTIKSTSSGTGSLIHSTASVNATVERHLTEEKWHFVSSPISNAKFDVFDLPDGSSDIFARYWKETTEEWIFIEDETTDMDVLKGYGIWVDNNVVQNETVEFAGTLNSDVSTAYSLTYTNTNTEKGWNLVGNPYPSALDWDASTGWTKTNMDNSIYYWNPATGSGNYSYYVGSGTAPYTGGISNNNGTKYIPAMQGFMVHCNNVSGGSLKIENGARVHNSQSFYKNTKNEIPYIKLKAEGNAYRDETVIRFFEVATEGFDSDFDAYKLYGKDEAPQLYSIITEEILAINSLPDLDEYRIVPLGFECSIPEIFTIEASEIESFEEFITIYLEDIKEGTLQNLSNNPSYSFTHKNGDDPARFLLHFGDPNGIDESGQQNVRIYSNENVVYIIVPENTKGNIVIYNMMGQEVTSATVNNVLNKITLEKSAYYVVKVISNESMVTKKVFIK